MKIKNIRRFNRGREAAHLPPKVESKAIPTLPKTRQFKTETVREFINRGGLITYVAPSVPHQRRYTLTVVTQAPASQSSVRVSPSSEVRIRKVCLKTGVTSHSVISKASQAKLVA